MINAVCYSKMFTTLGKIYSNTNTQDVFPSSRIPKLDAKDPTVFITHMTLCVQTFNLQAIGG